MSRTIPNWGGGDIYRDETKRKLTNLVSFMEEPKEEEEVFREEIGGVLCNCGYMDLKEGWQDRLREHRKTCDLSLEARHPVPPKRLYILSHTQVQYEIYCRETLGVNPRDQSRVTRVIDDRRIRGQVFRRDQVICLDGWFLAFTNEERWAIEDFLESAFLKAGDYK